MLPLGCPPWKIFYTITRYDPVFSQQECDNSGVECDSGRQAGLLWILVNVIFQALLVISEKNATLQNMGVLYWMTNDF